MAVIITLFICMITLILAFVSWEKRMSPYHFWARLGFFSSGLSALGCLTEVEHPAAMFGLIFLFIACFIVMFIMFTQSE